MSDGRRWDRATDLPRVKRDAVEHDRQQPALLLALVDRRIALNTGPRR